MIKDLTPDVGIAHGDAVAGNATTQGRFVFGWAKPVPVDPYNLKNPKKDSAIISLAGPASNLVIALIVSIIARVFPLFTIIAVPFVMLNVSLAIFNLIPIPPLDGSKILFSILPYSWRDFEFQLERYGFFLILLFVFFGFGLILPLIFWLFGVITGQPFGF